MMRLVAVNERLAVYVKDRKALNIDLDGERYIDDLLKIRSAKTLVRFLKKYPHTLRSSYSLDHLVLTDKSDVLSGYKPRFGSRAISGDSIMKATGDDVDYFDSLVDAEFPPAVTGPIWGRELDLAYLEIKDLESLAKKIRAILMMVLSSYGMHTCDQMFDFRKPSWYSEEDAPDHCNGYFTFKKEYLAEMLPEIHSNLNFTLFKLSDGYAHRDDEKPPLVIYDDGAVHDRIEIDTSLNKDDAIREASGVLVAYALKYWLTKTKEEERVVYSNDEGYQLQKSSISPVVSALINIISDKRVGICEHCGNPFVSMKTLDGKENSKKHCSDTCKSQSCKQEC